MTTDTTKIAAELREALKGVTLDELELSEARDADGFYMVVGGQGQSFGCVAGVTELAYAHYLVAAQPKHVAALLDEMERLRTAVAGARHIATTASSLQREAEERLAKAVEVLRELVRINEEHNDAIAKVVGKPVGWKDDYLDPARAFVTKMEGGDVE